MSTMEFKTAGQRIEDICDELELPHEVRKTAYVLADVVGDFHPDGRNVEWAGGREPGAVATACVYVADLAIRKENRYTQEQLADRAPGSHLTIRKNFHDIPSVFFENATEGDLARLHDDVEAVLREFHEAEQEGVGVHNIDFEPPFDEVWSRTEQADN